MVLVLFLSHLVDYDDYIMYYKKKKCHLVLVLCFCLYLVLVLATPTTEFSTRGDPRSSQDRRRARPCARHG